MKLKIGLFVIVGILISNCSDQKDKKFTNPILSGFYPDPSICKVGDDFYLVNSTFSYFPGIPVFHSKDLVNWKLIGHVLDRHEQLNTEGMGVSRGIFAPDINYYNEKFYVTCTVVDGGGNFVVTSTKPEGPYSNPVFLPNVNGIDPSLYFDEDGKSYILFNSDAPEKSPLYEGHRTVRMFEFDAENLKVVGNEKILIDGGSDITKKPIWIEGPHIYKKYGYYYLMAAEGGTAEDHSEVIFRSQNIWGPYISYSGNPILTQRNLDPKRKNPITSTGHADLVELENGEWWAVYLGCRPYNPPEKNYYNLGRETFLAPVKWIKEENSDAIWPLINPDFEEVQYYYNYPKVKVNDQPESIPYSGNFSVKYEFDKNDLNKNFIFLRTPLENWHSLIEKENYLAINLRPETCSEKTNPSFIGHRQQHNNCKIVTSLNFNPILQNEKAGLVTFMNETHFYFICKSIENNDPVIQLYKSDDDISDIGNMKLIATNKIDRKNIDKEVQFKINAEGQYYSFEYSFDNKNWITLKKNVDGTFLRSVIPVDFVGCVIGMYATSNGKLSNNKAYFNWFEYIGNDEIYN